MMGRIIKIGTIVFLGLMVVGHIDAGTKSPVLKGAYLGQTPPGSEPRIFAPGTVSTGMPTRDIAMTPDGNEIYFCIEIGNYKYSTILVTRNRDGIWTEPEVAPFASDPRYTYIEPCISPGGKRFFFASNQPSVESEVKAGPPTPKNMDIWVMDRVGEGWGEPKNLGSPVNSEGDEFFPSITKDRTLYFTREHPDRSNAIYRSRCVNDRYQEPQKLPSQVNAGISQFNAFISPGEDYLIVCIMGLKESFGATDYFIVFRNPDDTWMGPINMGNKINMTGGIGYTPYVSPDKKYFFFMSNRPKEDLFAPGERFSYAKLKEIYLQPGNGNSCIYWIDAGIIHELKQKIPAR